MTDYLWWREGVIYQIYPRSFADSNGNGLGDLQGVISRLDYLSALGIDAIWLSPFYPTPDADFGYDISDHTDVDARFGTLDDFDELVSESHRRGIRVVLDLVLNHTSERHPWFQTSRASRDNPKADWYLWQDSIPNRWQSVFGGKAWTYVPQRNQYYYHMFLPQQPDVNWRNAEVYQAQMDVVRFWLARGVDGFRLDVFNVYYKDALLRENPRKLGRRAFERQRHLYDTNRPELIPLLKELRSLLDEYPERYAVGETFLAAREKITAYCGADKLHAAFNFDFLRSKYQPKQFLAAIEDWEKISAATGIWPNYVLSNHDVPRSATRYAKGESDARAKLAITMLLTLRGTPFLYYGEEIGMRDISLRRNEILDPPGKKYWPFNKGRDGCRSPMQWDDSANAGFSSVKPWLKVHPNYTQRNVAAQINNPDSLLQLTRALIALRKKYPALRRGNFSTLKPSLKGTLAYQRALKGEHTVLVALNFTNREKQITLPEGNWRDLISGANHTKLLSLASEGICILAAQNNYRK